MQRKMKVKIQRIQKEYTKGTQRIHKELSLLFSAWNSVRLIDIDNYSDDKKCGNLILNHRNQAVYLFADVPEVASFAGDSVAC